MCGLCGDYDGSPANDFAKPDGTMATSVNDFGNSWKTEKDEDDLWVCMLFLLLLRQAWNIMRQAPDGLWRKICKKKFYASYSILNKSMLFDISYLLLVTYY